MFRMQCVEFDEKKICEAFEKYNCTFAEMYKNIMKLLSNKQGRTIEEQFFIDRRLNEEFYPRDCHIVDPGFFTIFTRLYPDINFRLYEITWDLLRCSTYIFRGEEYAFEKKLQDFEHDRNFEINGMKFYNPNFKPYHPDNLQVILDIMEIENCDGISGAVSGSEEPYEFCIEFVTPAMKNLEFKKFEGFDKKFTELAGSWYKSSPIGR